MNIHSFSGSAWERTLPKLCFDTRDGKRSFRKVPSQAEPWTEHKPLKAEQATVQAMLGGKGHLSVLQKGRVFKLQNWRERDSFREGS